MPDPTPEEIATIVRGLTDSQIEFLLGGKSLRGFALTISLAAGLVYYQPINPMRSKQTPTPLGLAVRAHLNGEGERG